MSVVLLTAIVVICGIIVSKICKHWKLAKSVSDVPGPKAVPILGNVHQIGSNPKEYMENMFIWWEKYGVNQPYKIWLMNQLFLVISDPKNVETILTSNPPLKKGKIYDLLRPWLGDGLLTSSGTKWFKHRKVITPSFHFTILVDFFDIINNTSNSFIEKLSEKAKTGEIFDIQAIVHYCTLDIICETAMGVNLDSMNNPKSEVVTAYQDICYLVQDRTFKPLQHNDSLYRFTSAYCKSSKALDILRTFTSDVISKRQKLTEGTKEESNEYESKFGYSKKKVFLDTLLTANIDGRPLSFSDVFEEVSTFMFEGHDTTTSGITFAIFLLSRHPEVQEKVFQEQKLIFENDLRRDATFQEMAEMKYLDLVIKETQRMYPSVPLIARQVTEKFNLNGRELLPGTTATIFLIGMGYNEDYFPEPRKFNPDRFDSTKRDKFNPFEYVPFSAGPRNCIGQKFAIMEMKCIVSKIVRNFEILPAVEGLPPCRGYDPSTKRENSYEPVLSCVLTLKSESGVLIRLRPRKV